MYSQIEKAKAKLEMYSIYRTLKSVNDWVADKLDICQIFLIVIGFLNWPMCAFWLLVNAKVFGGVMMLVIYIMYWAHITLLED